LDCRIKLKTNKFFINKLKKIRNKKNKDQFFKKLIYVTLELIDKITNK